MGIFGTNYPKLVVSSSGYEIGLEESKVDYSFFNPDVIEHVSVLNGYRSFAYSRNQSNFRIDLNLCNYSSSEAKHKFEVLYQNKNEPWIFYPHENFATASVDVYGEPIQYFITDLIPYYLDSDSNYDAVLISLSPRKNSVLYANYTLLGYGLTIYGLEFGF